MENENPSLSSPTSIEELEEPVTKKPKMSSTTTATSDDEDTTTTTTDGTAAKPRRYKRRKVAIFFAYCGVNYQGMQKNPGAKTIEGDLEEALYQSGAVPEHDRGQHKRYDWARSARTDKGVSAVGQVVSGRFYVDPPGFVERLNSNLPSQIRIFGFKRATASFNAKKFCDRRRYVYLLPVFALDPSCHRDRESVIASLGSGNELVKCFECSERGRKVEGLMGNKRNSDLNIDLLEQSLGNDVGVGDNGDLVQSGISSNTEAALVTTEEKEKEKELLKSYISVDSNHNTSLENKGGVGGNEDLVQSGISSNIEAALVTTEEKEKELLKSHISVDSNHNTSLENNGGVGGNEDLVQSGILSNTEAALLENNGGVGIESNGVKPVSVIGEEKSGGGYLNGCENRDEGEKEKRSEFKYGKEEKERFNRILKYYEGTHNFHNFTTRTKAEDPSAKRYIVSFEAKTTLVIEGIEFIKCEVVGQSFMLHQIRKMMGMAVAIMRNFAPESIFERAFEQNVNINVPTAPEVGLFLDECLFTSYNNKWKDTHEELSMKAYAEEAEEFKLNNIYTHIANTEHKEGAVALWLHSLNHRNYPDLRLIDGGSRAVGENTSIEEVVETPAEGENMPVLA